MSTSVVLGPVVAWLLSVMLAAAPPDRLTRGRTAPEAVETVEQATARYEEFARTVALVAYDPAESPLFGGADGRSRTAAVMLSVAFHESGFRRDVSLGVGSRARGDHGRSCTAWQFNIGSGKNISGHTCDELLADPEQAARDALRVLRVSMKSCAGLPVEERLSMYTAGRCEPGQIASRSRFRMAVRWFDRRREAWQDRDIVAALKVGGVDG